MSDSVDALYIATPHPQHRDLAIAAIEAGKAVLVEKAFAATVEGAERMIEAARQHEVFAMEAMWTRFQPAIVAVRELVDAGAIGEPRQVQADLGVNRPYDPADRLYDPARGGGATLDLGVYVVSFAHYFLGRPDSVTATGSLAPTGVDADAAIMLGYDDGRIASLITTLRHQTPGAARITGTEGWIEVLPRFHHPTTFVITRDRSRPGTGGATADRWRLRARVDRGHRGRAGRSDREFDHAAGRFARRPADPGRGLPPTRRRAPRR